MGLGLWLVLWLGLWLVLGLVLGQGLGLGLGLWCSRSPDPAPFLPGRLRRQGQGAFLLLLGRRKGLDLLVLGRRGQLRRHLLLRPVVVHRLLVLLK